MIIDACNFAEYVTGYREIFACRCSVLIYNLSLDCVILKKGERGNLIYEQILTFWLRYLDPLVLIKFGLTTMIQPSAVTSASAR